MRPSASFVGSAIGAHSERRTASAATSPSEQAKKMRILVFKAGGMGTELHFVRELLSSKSWTNN
jgi:hypothetical protein